MTAVTYIQITEKDLLEFAKKTSVETLRLYKEESKLCIKEVAEIENVEEQTVRSWINHGIRGIKLKAYKNPIRVSPRDLEEFNNKTRRVN